MGGGRTQFASGGARPGDGRDEVVLLRVARRAAERAARVRIRTGRAESRRERQGLFVSMSDMDL